MRRLLPALVPLLAPAVVVAVQWPSADNYFALDDFEHLFARANEPLLEFLIKPHGGHPHLAGNAVFALLHALFGTRPEPYHGLPLALHVANAALLQRLLARLAGPGPALLGSALWGTAALHAWVIGWHSAFGIVLAATCLLWILGDVAALGPGEAPRARLVLRWYALLLVMGTGLGAGIGIAATLFAPLWLLLPRSPGRRRAVLVLATVPALLLAIVLLQETLYAQLSGTPARPRGLVWAVLALEAERIPGVFAGLLAYGFATLVAPLLTLTGLGQPAFPPLAGLALAEIQRVVWVVSAAAALLLGLALRRGPAAFRRRALALLAIAVAGYAPIAVGRVGVMAMHGSPVEWVAVQPRYHSLAPLAYCVLLCLQPGALARPAQRAVRAARVAAILWLGLAVATNAWIVRAVDRPGGPDRRRFERAVAEMRREVRAHPPGATVRLENTRAARADPSLFPGRVGYFVIAFGEDEIEGRPVRFVERDRRVVERARARPRTRLARLLVGSRHERPPPGASPRRGSLPP